MSWLGFYLSGVALLLTLGGGAWLVRRGPWPWRAVNWSLLLIALWPLATAALVIVAGLILFEIWREGRAP